MNADDFAKAIGARLPKECPARTGRELLEILFGEAAKVIQDLPPAEVDETEAAMYGVSASGSPE